jgi:NADH dehydrogenase
MLIEPPACIGLLGGTGFVGRSLARQLDEAGYQVRVLTRHDRLVAELAVLPKVQMRRLNRPGDPAALADALRGCSAVVNLVGILHESAGASFQAVHVAQTESLLGACRFAGVARFLQISALGASPDAPSRYLRSKAEAEARVQASPLAATILRPSVIFGRDDGFLNLFADLTRLLPVVVLACPEARFQPIHVEDVARSVVRCLQRPDTIGQTLELGGPQVLSLRELVTRVGDWIGVRRPILGLSPGLSMLQATLLEALPVKLMTRDNVRSMQVANVCAGPFPEVLGFVPAALDTLAPDYLAPAAGRARYGRMRQHAGR